MHMHTLHPPPRSNPDGDVSRRNYRKKNGGGGSGESFAFFCCCCFFLIRLCSPYSFDQLALYPRKEPLHNRSVIWGLYHFYITPDVLYFSCRISSKKLPSKDMFLPRNQTSRETSRVFKKLKKITFINHLLVITCTAITGA